MRIITHDDGRCLTLRLLGELDHAAAQEVMPGIEDAVEEYLPRRRHPAYLAGAGVAPGATRRGAPARVAGHLGSRRSVLRLLFHVPGLTTQDI